MRNRLIATYRRLLDNTNQKTYRYLFSSFNLESRLTGLIGPRGTGKTTLLLQYINKKIPNKGEAIYISLDNISFTQTKLIDLVEDLYELDGVRIFFFDEVHKYPSWNQELKNIYDSYPDVKIIFSGSSSLDLIQGTYDLSRRGILFGLGGMSFREYLEFSLEIKIPRITFEEIIKRETLEELLVQISSLKKLRVHFLDYLKFGYYPFIFEDKVNYLQKLLNVIEKIIYEDIANFYRLKTENLINLKKIISYLATIPPGELNRNNIAKHTRLDNKTINNYLKILSETGLVYLLSEGKGGSRILKGIEKIYLDNFNIYEAIINEIGHSYDKGTIREIFFIKMLQNSGSQVYFSKIGDFQVEGYNFEVGGKNKSKKQIKDNLTNSFLVKDDLWHPSGNTLPLYIFGFLY